MNKKQNKEKPEDIEPESIWQRKKTLEIKGFFGGARIITQGKK